MGLIRLTTGSNSEFHLLRGSNTVLVCTSAVTPFSPYPGSNISFSTACLFSALYERPEKKKSQGWPHVHINAVYVSAR